MHWFKLDYATKAIPSRRSARQRFRSGLGTDNHSLNTLPAGRERLPNASVDKLRDAGFRQLHDEPRALEIHEREELLADA